MRTDKANQLRSQIEASLDRLANAIDGVRASEMFQQFLAVQARFHAYSWRNTLLIAMQRPDATRVAGYRTWQKLGRQVRKGEYGITICAPCPYRREAVQDNGNAETVEGIYFRAVHVFDVAQTDGEALPTIDLPTVDVVADALLSDLVRVADSRGIAVSFQELSGSAFGVSKRGRIEIDNTHPTGQQAKTLSHELAHEALHWTAKESLTATVAELEAESVAYVVCLHFGLDVEVRASRYIALWNGDAKALKASLHRITATARTIIDDLESLRSGKGVAA
ncbi:MAG: ArdC family protein [Planctomycetota bacterium]